MAQHEESAADRLDQLIADYLREKESGENPDEAEWIQKHPEYAEELMEFFEDEMHLGRFADQALDADNGLDRTSNYFAGPNDRNDSTLQFHKNLPRVNVDRYVVTDLHGRGGMGEVWRAKDEQIGRQVALKTMRPGHAEQRDRFLIEAQITGQLEHPSIIPLHDIGVDPDGSPFYVMKFVNGRTLKDAILDFHSSDIAARDKRQLQQQKLLQVFVDLCHAVGFAHSRGVLHRDLKPTNIMIGDYGETLLLDWGLAKVMGESEKIDEPSFVRVTSSGDSSATQDGSIVGSPPYMAPEMAEGNITELDVSTDVYLLGSTLYEILTGRPPREGSSKVEIVELARTVNPPQPRKLNPQIPKPLDAICRKAMSQRKKDRYESAQQLGEDLQCYLAGERVAAYRENPWERGLRWCKHNHRLLKRCAATILLLAVATVVTSIIQANSLLIAKNRARDEIKRFRQLANETWYFISSVDPPAENAPYYNSKRGIELSQQAIQIAEAWGPELLELPIAEERDGLREELYQLRLLAVQAGLEEDREPEQLLRQLEQSRVLRAPCTEFYRLQSQCLHLLNRDTDAEKAAANQQAATTRKTVLHYFLAGESYRRKATREFDLEKDIWAWQPDTAALNSALRQYRAAVKLKPNHYWSHLQIGRCLLSLDQKSEAIQALGTCIALQPDVPWAYSVRGLICALADRFDDARRDLDHVIEKHPEFMPTRINRGISHWLQSDSKAALADFKFVLAQPEHQRLVEVAYYQAVINFAQRKDKQALADLATLIAARPGFHHAYRIRAKHHFQIGSIDEGLSDLDRLIELRANGNFSRGSWQQLYQRGRFLHRLIDTRTPDQIVDLAIHQLIDASKLPNSNRPLVFEVLGKLLEQSGRFAYGVKVYTDILRTQPTTQVLNLRGWAHFRLLQPGLAMADFQESIALDPQDAEAYSGLGYVLAFLGKKIQDAEHHAAQALFYGDGDYLILHNVACIYAKLAEAVPDRQRDYEDLALVQLRRAVDLWKKGATSSHDELEEIRNDEALDSLHHRPEFQQLIK